jgi:hypothetical protein
MSWNQGGIFYESYLHDASTQQKVTSGGSSTDMKTGGTSTGPRTGGFLSDGQMTVALDKDLLDLIDSINLELSRTGTSTTDLSVASGSSGGSFVSIDSDSPPILSDTRLNSFNSQASLEEVPTHARTRSSYLVSGRTSSTFFSDVPAIPEGTNEDGISPKSITFEDRSGVPEEYWSRPPVYKGPRSPRTAFRPDTASSQAIQDEPLPQVLHALDDEDDSRIVVIRRITKLGFKSNRIIKTAFQRLGWEVKNVVLLPSRARSMYPEGTTRSPNNVSVSHARPSSMGFVVFKSKGAASDCIKGRTVNVEGIEVLVQPFVRQYKPTTGVPSRGKLLLST